ncbi:DUF3553 domain-containing protein [Fodinicurvata sediminis]|uniref:DUF3553 domain-containing protein n=1 Tax=Fodinicurvata sediminis TaxID=1121832 RepID=UPI0003B61C21|nr:DUF3553 domain-containing protein [Fodinicurvata sediminis]
MSAFLGDIVPGTFVYHPTRKDWGLGQVQSVIGDRITVNFENAGKVLINSALIELQLAQDEDTPHHSKNNTD